MQIEMARVLLKVGAGTPPVLTDLGWLVFHHGVRSVDLRGSASREELT